MGESGLAVIGVFLKVILLGRSFFREESRVRELRIVFRYGRFRVNCVVVLFFVFLN